MCEAKIESLWLWKQMFWPDGKVNKLLSSVHHGLWYNTSINHFILMSRLCCNWMHMHIASSWPIETGNTTVWCNGEPSVNLHPFISSTVSTTKFQLGRNNFLPMKKIYLCDYHECVLLGLFYVLPFYRRVLNLHFRPMNSCSFSFHDISLPTLIPLFPVLTNLGVLNDWIEEMIWC